jgi:tRNA-dihydrouridine synthase A
MNKTDTDRRLSIAPMMDWTDRHDRYFLRLISPNAWLYSEMVTAPAIIHGDRHKLLSFNRPEEHPIALQLGGADADQLAEAARIGADFGYDEINLNCGCPSDRVQSGQFGACLMHSPNTVAKAVSAMRHAVNLPVTIKCRIGIDDSEDYPFLRDFIDPIADAGCKIFIVHARKAWLKGLSPKENRDIPPLCYDVVYRLKQDRQDLTIIINGGITTLAACHDHLNHVDGVMIGREAYHNPWFLTELEQGIFNGPIAENRADIARAMIPYLEEMAAQGTPVRAITRHMLGLYNARRGGRLWRRILTEGIRPGETPTALMERALDAVNVLLDHNETA